MEPNTLIYALNEFIVIIFRKILQNYTYIYIDTIFIIINIFSIINFQGLVARQPYLCKNIVYLVCTWMLGTFVNSSCDIKKIVKLL